MPEQWRSVIGFEGFYEVSDHGRVRSVDRVTTKRFRGRVLSPNKHPNGYLLVSLHTPQRKLKAKIHRLVAEAFISSGEGRECDHVDHDKTNNRVSNLRWVSHKENMQAAHAAKRFSPVHNHKQAARFLLSAGDVQLMHKLRAAGTHPLSLAATFKVTIGSVHRILRGDRWPELHPSKGN